MASKRTLLVLVLVFLTLWLITVVIAVVLGVRPTVLTTPDSNADPPKNETSKWGKYSSVAVATDNEICSGVGRDILIYGGGSTVDAAIAAMICLGMVNPQHVGLGGGFNAVIYERPRNETVRVYKSLNARETVSPSVDVNFYERNPAASKTGPMTILIPGELNGYWKAWQTFGRVPWSDLFQPTIQMARHGWNVSESMSVSIQSRLSYIRADPGLSDLLLKPDKSPYVFGDQMKNPKLADLLEAIANQGPSVFYSGEIARNIILDIQDIGGPNYTLSDLQSNQAIFADPLQSQLTSSGYDLYTTTLPSSGVLTSFVLRIMDGYNYTSSNLKDLDSVVLFYHRLIESWKIAIMQTENVGDLGFNTSVEEWTKQFLSDGNVDWWRSRIKDGSALDPSSLTSSRRENDSTSGVCIMGADGSGVALTTTVGGLWGMKRRGLRTGIIFNDGMSLFSLRSATNITANYIEPLKHGRSSTSPILIVDKKTKQIRMMHGAAGNLRIVTSISFVASNVLWRGLEPNVATDEPRVHHQGFPNTVTYDDFINQAIVAGLQKKGHSLQPRSLSPYSYLGVAQMIQMRGCPSNCPERMELFAVSDYRKGVDAAPKGI